MTGVAKTVLVTAPGMFEICTTVTAAVGTTVVSSTGVAATKVGTTVVTTSSLVWGDDAVTVDGERKSSSAPSSLR